MTTTTNTDFWTVQTTTGMVKGHAETGVAAFRGIPYAEPPVGERRFRRAVPIAAWDEVLDARSSGDYCYQFRNKSIGWIGSEDCLWLNVVVPASGGEHAIDEQANRPIAVHLHGGSNIHGSAADPMRSGEHFATATDSIFVGVNYRLGMFGQLFFGEDHDDDRIDTNAGLSDILTAIDWIRDNARAFGGDPDRITIFGESSGGAMVTALMTSPYLEGKIAGAIAESPAGGMVHSFQTYPLWRDKAIETLEDLRQAEHGELGVHNLLTATAEELGQITETLSEFNLAQAPGGLSGGFAPIIDGDILPAHPLNAGSQRDLPLLVGYNRDEYRLMRFEKMTTAAQRTRSTRLAHNLAGEAGADLLAEYNGGKNRADNGEFIGHAIFVVPAFILAENHPGDRAWLYRLDMTTPFLKLSGIGATHAIELPLLFQRFDTEKGRMALALGGRETVVRTATAMLSRWKNFIHHQDPGFAPFATDTPSDSSEPTSGTMHIFDGKNFDEGEKTIAAPLTSRRLAWTQTPLMLE